MRIRILLTLLVLKIECKHSKKGTVRRDWNDVDNRNGRDVLEKHRRRSLRNQRDRERRRARCAARCASALAQLERVCTCIIIRICIIYIRELAHARPPMSSISLYSNTRNAYAYILPRAGHGRVYVRTYHLRTYQSTHACMHTHSFYSASMVRCGVFV